MKRSNSQPPDDPSSAPESGTVRNETSGNQPAHPHERPPQMAPTSGGKGSSASDNREKDSPSTAAEEA